MVLVTGISSKIVSPGLEFTVFGGFFGPLCRVKFGDVVAVVDSFSEDFITVVVPEINGVYSATVEDGDGNSVVIGDVTVGPMENISVYNYVRNYQLDDFEQFVQGLFPRGQLFDFENGSAWKKLVLGISFAIFYLWSLIRSYLVAMCPQQTENFDEWERELSLPELGITPESDDERRREIYRVGFSKGGCSIEYYKRILSLLKVNADIWEWRFNPERFDDYVFGPNDVPAYFMMIRFKVPFADIDYFRAGVSTAGDRVSDYSNYQLETIFEKIKQAHIKIVYAYAVPVLKNLVTSDGKKLVTGQGKQIVVEVGYPD